MTTVTDTIVLILMLLFLWGGWRKGLFRVLIGPIFFLLCSIAAIIYFDLTHNIFISLTIALVGSVILTLLAKLFLFIGRASIDKEFRNRVFIGSRILGSLVNLAWRGSVALSLLLLISFLPLSLFGLEEIQEDIKKSRTYSLISLYLIGEIPSVRNTMNVLAAMGDPEQMRHLSSTPEFEDFMNDKKITDLKSDPKIFMHVTNRDFAQLVSHPKIIAIIRDDALMGKLTDLGKKIYQEKAGREKKEEK